MNQQPGPTGAGHTEAERDLARVQDKVASARSVLLRLLQDVVVAESRLNNCQAAQVVAANEALVIAALQHQADARAVQQALNAKARVADIDPLTQLPNRVLLLDRFTQAMATAKRRGTRLALLFLDLNDFKRINDTLGHAVGDAVLQQVALRLASAVREADTVSRHGGDEFLILLTEVSQRADVAMVAGQLLAVLGAPCRLGDQLLQLTASIGISLYPDDGVDASTLINHADAAMYRAKHQGPGKFAFHGEAPVESTGLSAPLHLTPHEQALAEHQRRNAHLREANERLVLAALDAQALQAAAERAQRRQAELLDAVAEELANPQAPIRLATAMLGRASTDEPLLPRVRAIIEQQVGHMSRLVGAASRLARAGRDEAEPGSSFSELGVVVDQAVQACRPALDLRQQRLTVTLPADPIALRGDPAQVVQILHNLLDNASKYTRDQGAIRVDAVIDGWNIVITVADDGIGITPAAVPGLFEPFVQDSQAIGFNGVGVGIGLPVVQFLVKELGGTVSAESAGNGRGSRFVVTLPLADAGRLAAGEPGAALAQT